MRFRHICKITSILVLVILLLSVGAGIFHAILRNNHTSSTDTTPDPSSDSNSPATIAKIPEIYTRAQIDPIKTTLTTAPSSDQDPILINISGYTTPIFTTSSLGTNPGAAVALYDGQFLFAHSSGPFSSLSSAGSFQITRGGTVENYKIVKTALYCDYSNLQQHGQAYSCNNYAEPQLPTLAFGNIADYYDARAFGYDLILMTCAGDYLPGQDATHRLLAYATRS